jgi:hypothetical protein
VFQHWRGVGFALGCGLLFAGFFGFVSYIYVSGMYTPLGSTQYFLAEDAWSDDSLTVQFRAEFPFGVEFEVGIDGTNLRAIGYPDAKRYSSPSGFYEDYYQSVEEQFNLEDVQNAQASPDGQSLAVITHTETTTSDQF